MKPSDLLACLNVAMATDTPAFIWGASGIGKSDLVRQLGQQHDMPVVDMRLVLFDPTDLKGFPQPQDGHVTWLPPDNLPQEALHGPRGILFFDEMLLAKHAVQGAAFQLILDRKLGNYKLPDGWRIIAASNRTEDRAAIHTMPGPLANRFLHFTLEVDVPEWSAWAASAGVSDMLRAFLQFRPNLAHNFDPRSPDPAFPSLRSWVYMDRVVRSQPPTVLERRMAAAAVGEAAAGEFFAFCETAAELPTLEQVLHDPARAPLPTSPSAKYAVVASLDRHASPKVFGALVQYVKRLDVEFQTLFMQSAFTLNKDVTNTAAWRDWFIENKDFVL